MLGSGGAPGVAAAALGKANVWFNPRRRAMAMVEQTLIHNPNGPLVICLSDYVKRFVREHYPELPDERMVRLFNAVDLARFSPPETRAKSDWVDALIIAQDYERKGLGEAIRAVYAKAATLESEPPRESMLRDELSAMAEHNQRHGAVGNPPEQRVTRAQEPDGEACQQRAHAGAERHRDAADGDNDDGADKSADEDREAEHDEVGRRGRRDHRADARDGGRDDDRQRRARREDEIAAQPTRDERRAQREGREGE